MDVKLYMEPKDIVKSYEEAANKRKQIAILAQLNLCKESDILDVLRDNGVDHRTLPRNGKNVAAKEEEKVLQEKIEQPMQCTKSTNTDNSANSADVEDSLENTLSYVKSLKRKRQLLLDELSRIEEQLHKIATACKIE